MKRHYRAGTASTTGWGKVVQVRERKYRVKKGITGRGGLVHSGER